MHYLCLAFLIALTLLEIQAQSGLRCRGRNFDQGARCCTRDQPCGEGEGDCENNAECGLGLECGTNNCKQFGDFFHKKDDCCVRSGSSRPQPVKDIEIFANQFGDVPIEPPAGQRCRGRNYEGKRCCSPEQPCNEGEGDCDGRGDGGLNDGDRGCKGDLICGSNNCLQFGLYYHPKDDCCEKPGATSSTTTRKPNPIKPLGPAKGKYRLQVHDISEIKTL